MTELAIYWSGRLTFRLFQRYEFHSAFWTIAGMIRHDFWMHRARVFLFLLLIACRAVAAQELSPYEASAALISTRLLLES